MLRKSPEVWRTPSIGSNLEGGGQRGSGPVVQSVAVLGLSEVRVAGTYSKTSIGRTEPSTSAANQIPPSRGQNAVTPVLVAPSATTCSDTEVMVTASTNIEGEKSSEDVVVSSWK